MIEAQSWGLKKDETIYKAAGAAHLRKYGQFFENLADKCWQESSGLEYVIEGPIRLTYKVNEDISLLTLAETENKFFSKILASVGGTCREIRLLKAEANKFYNKLFGHGERCADQADYKIESLFSDLQDLSVYVNRIYAVLHLTIRQLSNLAHNAHREIYLPLLIEHLMDLFVTLVTLDELISGQPGLLERWKVYRIKVRSVIHNSSQLNIPEDRILMYERVLRDLHGQLLSKTLFLKSLEHVMDAGKSGLMSDHVVCYLKNVVSDVEGKINDSAAISRGWVQANVGVVVVARLFGACERKLLKRVAELNKKLYAVSLIGNVVWLPQDFLVDCLPSREGQGLSSLPRQVGEKLLAARVQRLAGAVDNLVQRAMLWSVEMQGLLIKTGFQIFSEIERKRNLLLEILALVRQMREHVSLVTNLHGFLLKPMSRATVRLVCRLVEAQKALETSFYTLGPSVVLAQSQVLQQLTYQILAILESVRRALGSSSRDSSDQQQQQQQQQHHHHHPGGVGGGSADGGGKKPGYSRERLDALALLGSSARLLSGPASPERRLVLRCALVCASQLSESFREEEVVRLRFLLDSYDAVVELFDQLAAACEYSVLLPQQRAMLPAYLTLAAEAGSGPLGHLGRLLQAYGSALLRQESAEESLGGARLAEQRQALARCLLEPACREIETGLRLHVHAHLRQPAAAAAAADGGGGRGGHGGGGQRLVRAGPLGLAGARLLSGRRYVEHYLDATFYNLTSVALHDWRAYRSMHALARHKLGLESVAEQLPSQSLEQGLDALELMRNIHVFVARYLYNLHSQTFVEQASPGRQLNTIGIRHVANSIRTHGTGIMSTSVNFVYQFLRVKLHTLSQFLFDEHIKSRLSRDVRFVRGQRERSAGAGSGPPYPYERADKFQRAIRKLGVSAEGLSCLDQFRQLIAQIGNALGYVRLIRSAGLHASANAVSFLPPPSSSSPSPSPSPSPERLSAPAARLEADLGDLVRNFTEGIHYFKLLVDVFAAGFRDAGRCQHLQQFYAIVPPLTLSHVDSALASKEKLFKKNKAGAAFTDDGFAVGLAYVNALLDQGAELDGLQWFRTAQEHFASVRAAAESRAELEDEKLQQTRALTLRRLEERSAEFQLLYYSLSGARVFFSQPDSS